MILAGVQAIHDAAAGGDMKVLQLLLAHKADVNAVTLQKETTAYMAIKGCHFEILKQLVKEG